MQYIKHNGIFYKQVDLQELDKKELIKLIKEAIEIQPQIIERWNTIYKTYDWYKPWYGSVTYLNNLSGGTTSQGGKLTGNDALCSLDKEHLITLCSTI